MSPTFIVQLTDAYGKAFYLAGTSIVQSIDAARQYGTEGTAKAVITRWEARQRGVRRDPSLYTARILRVEHRVVDPERQAEMAAALKKHVERANRLGYAND